MRWRRPAPRFRTPACRLAVLLALPLVAACNRGRKAMPSPDGPTPAGRTVGRPTLPAVHRANRDQGRGPVRRHRRTGSSDPRGGRRQSRAGVLRAGHAHSARSRRPACSRHCPRGRRQRCPPTIGRRTAPGPGSPAGPGHRLRPPAGADRRRTAVRHGTDRPGGADRWRSPRPTRPSRPSSPPCGSPTVTT